MIPEQPESRRHGEAWRRFCRAWVGSTREPAALREGWLWFLNGWLEKTKQADELRGKR